MNNGPPNCPSKQVLDLLCELDRIIAAHGLVRYRFTVEFLANSLEDGSYGTPGVVTELLKGKIAALRHGVLHELQCRVGSGESTVDGSSRENARAREIAQLFRECGLVLETARYESAQQAHNLTLLMPAILETATTDLLQAYLDGVDCSNPEARSVVTRSIGHQVGTAAAAICDCLENCRAQIAELLRSAKGILPGEIAPSGELAPSLWLRPHFDPSGLGRRLRLRPIGLWRLLGQAAVRRRIQRELENSVRDGLWESLRAYSALIRKWVRRNFCALELALSAAAETYRTHLLKALPSSNYEPKLLQAQEDFRLLQQWPAAVNPHEICLADSPDEPESFKT